MAAMTAEQLITPVNFFGVFNMPPCLSGIPQQPQHPSPRRAGDVSASDGIEGAFDLRRQLRRAVPTTGVGRDGRVVVAFTSMEESPALGGFSFGTITFVLPQCASIFFLNFASRSCRWILVGIARSEFT